MPEGALQFPNGNLSFLTGKICVQMVVEKAAEPAAQQVSEDVDMAEGDLSCV